MPVASGILAGILSDWPDIDVVFRKGRKSPVMNMIKQNSSKAGDVTLRRSATRLAAIQAMYQMILTEVCPEGVIDDFLKGAIGGEVVQEDFERETEEIVPLITLNPEMFTLLVRGVESRKSDLDAMIETSLDSRWDTMRLQPLLKAILRCALFELLDRPDVPPRVCVSEYVDIAGAFFDGPEAGMVNAVLDRVARQVRTEEMDPK